MQNDNLIQVIDKHHVYNFKVFAYTLKENETVSIN